MTGRATACLAAVWILLGPPAGAEWPFLTEEARNLPDGAVSFSAGVRWQERERETSHPEGELLSPPEGTYGSVPEIGGTLGVGSRAEVSFRYEYLVYDREDDGRDVETGDLRVWTKLGLLRTPSQAVSVRFGVKFPNSSDAGTNETDIFLSGLYDLTWWRLRLTGNVGLAVLGNPAQNRTQDDMLTWAAALLWQNPAGIRLGVEASGMNGPYGVDRRRDHRTYAAVAGWGAERWRFDTAVRRGVHQDEGWGWLAGVTYEGPWGEPQRKEPHTSRQAR